MGMVIIINVYKVAVSARIGGMLLIRITGSQLRAGRALAGLTIEDVATRAGLCRHSIRKWEGSSNAVPEANVSHLSRALSTCLKLRACASVPMAGCFRCGQPRSWPRGLTCTRR
jgi:hypothetical protein